MDDDKEYIWNVCSAAFEKDGLHTSHDLDEDGLSAILRAWEGIRSPERVALIMQEEHNG